MNATHQPDPGARAHEALGAQREDAQRDGCCRQDKAAPNERGAHANPCDKRLFCRLPSPLQLALLYRLHASAYRQSHDVRLIARRSSG